MALKVENKVEIHGNTYRTFSCDEFIKSPTDWYFEYITLNTNMEDWTLRPDTPINYNKESYPVGTIFLDSEPRSIYLTSTISNIVIDNTPPVFVNDDIQYMVFNSDYVCSLTIESDTPLDIAQLRIYCGEDEEILYEALRKNSEIIKTENLYDISLKKNGNLYTLKFTIDGEFDVTKLNEGLTVQVWDLAANTATYTTSKRWYNFKTYGDGANVLPLKIEFTEVNPINKIVDNTVVGKVLVKVSNPNTELYDIEPTVELNIDSIGYLDPTTLTYDKDNGILIFYVSNITDTGNVIVDAWLTVDNADIAPKVKNATFAEAAIGPFIHSDGGRKYHFNGYKPKYIADENYGAFIDVMEDFLNTCQDSLSTGNRIGQLEKIARVGNFNNIDLIENPLLDYYKEQFSFEITPNLMEYLTYLYYIPEMRNDNNE